VKRSIVCCLILLLTIPLGLAVRFAPLHLPWFWAKYLGSALWAIALYWLVAMLLPSLQERALFLIAFAIALAVELSRLTPERHIDAFRLTLSGRLLLGRYFSVKNIVAYFFAVAAASLSDAKLRPGRTASNGEAN